MSSILYECCIPTAESSSYQLLLLLLILCAQLQKLKQGVDYTDLELVVGSKSIATQLQYGKGVVHTYNYSYAVPRACGLVGAGAGIGRRVIKYCAHGQGFRTASYVDGDRPKLGVV